MKKYIWRVKQEFTNMCGMRAPEVSNTLIVTATKRVAEAIRAQNKQTAVLTEECGGTVRYGEIISVEYLGRIRND